MLYQFKCDDCDSVQIIKCSVNNRPESIECTKCGTFMGRDFKGEGASFQLKGSCWDKDGYGLTHRWMVQDSDRECLKIEKENIKRDKANGTYKEKC